MTFLWINYYIFNKQPSIDYLYCNKFVMIAGSSNVKNKNARASSGVFLVKKLYKHNLINTAL